MVTLDASKQPKVLKEELSSRPVEGYKYGALLESKKARLVEKATSIAEKQMAMAETKLENWK